MKCIIFNNSPNKDVGLTSTTSSLLKNSYNVNDIQLSVINTGAVSVSSIEDQQLKNALILHITNTEDNGIDIENRLISQTKLTENDIKLINVEELIDSVIPKNSLNFNNKVFADESMFINYSKTCDTIQPLQFKTTLKLSSIMFSDLREQLMGFVQQISKIAFFIDRNELGIKKLSDYLHRLSSLIGANLDDFSSSQFQQISSIIKHCDVDEFDFHYNTCQLSSNPLVNKIIENIDSIKANTTQRLNFNFKGLKIYLTSKSISCNLLGASFNNPKPKILNICLSHLLMCNQIQDLDDKLERIKLLQA